MKLSQIPSRRQKLSEILPNDRRRQAVYITLHRISGLGFPQKYDQRRNLHVSVVCQRTARETSLVVRMQSDGVSGRTSRWKSNRWFQQNSGSGTYRIAPKSSFFLRK